MPMVRLLVYALAGAYELTKGILQMLVPPVYLANILHFAATQ